MTPSPRRFTLIYRRVTWIKQRETDGGATAREHDGGL
jgi:hypothetical protein